MATEDFSPAVKALDMAERVERLFFRLSELERGEIEKIVIPDDLKDVVKVILNLNPPKNIFLMGDTLYYSEHPIVGQFEDGLVEVLSERVNLCGEVITIKMSPGRGCNDAEIAINPIENTIVLSSEGTEMQEVENEEGFAFVDLSSEEKYRVEYYCAGLVHIIEEKEN